MAPVLAQRGFYLGGGTAVALHLGHRRSVDLDWFTSSTIEDPLRLAQELRDDGVALVAGAIDRGTLHGEVASVRVSLLEYRYPLLEAPRIWRAQRCTIASLDDLAAMKLSAIAQRGARKDFIDVHALGLGHRPLPDMLDLYRRKFATSEIAPVLFGLAYFDDAEREPMPTMLRNVDWRTVKKTIRGWLAAIAQ